MYFDKYPANDNIFFSGLKRSMETNVLKNYSFRGGKSFCHFFPGVIERKKLQRPMYKSPQGILTITVELLGSFFKT